MIEEVIQTKVLLPERLFREAQNKEELIRLVMDYMTRYPDYTVKSIKQPYAISERRT